jgi:hypothetical protein
MIHNKRAATPGRCDDHWGRIIVHVPEYLQPRSQCNVKKQRYQTWTWQ